MLLFRMIFLLNHHAPCSQPNGLLLARCYLRSLVALKIPSMMNTVENICGTIVNPEPPGTSTAPWG